MNIAYLIFLGTFFIGSLQAHLPTLKQTIEARKRLEETNSPHCVAIPEGGFVYYFHPMVKQWLEKWFDEGKIQEIRKELGPHLKIPLSNEGFTQASTRRGEDEVDETSYSAVWVRDCCWHYYGLKISDRTLARRLILRLIDFYSTDEQIERFLAVIVNPTIADPSLNPNAKMQVPLIRFSRKTLSHHQVNGQDQIWNHLQFDSHGLFLLAVSDALSSNIIGPEDLNYKALALFPAFFSQTRYWERKDAGPWEEELMNNASSVGLIAAGLDRIMKVAGQRLERAGKQYKSEIIQASLTPKNIERLYQLGVKQVERNLKLGAEAPNVNGDGLDRRADAALLFLCLPDHSLYANDPDKMREILNITLSLVGPYGVYRYRYDGYQALNYWIVDKHPSAISGESPDVSFVTRFQKGYMPSKQPYDAQWFFDSNFASIYYNLSRLESDLEVRLYYLRKGDRHLKRCLGQLTGPGAIAANGESLKPLQLPESINAIFDERNNFQPMPSPICPLGWATAALLMALDNAQLAHMHL